MRNIDEILKSPRLSGVKRSEDGFSALYTVHSFQASLICSWGAGWEHVSIMPLKKRIVPSWEDMCYLKDIIFEEDEAVIQIHPPKAEYVNNAPNCLHLWRCRYKDMVLPPSILVGITIGQTEGEIKKAIKEAYELAGETFTP